MSHYFTGNERMQTFEKLGTPMRMGKPSDLEIPDYQVLRNLVNTNEWDQALQYLTAFHAQNMFMNSTYFEWSIIIINYYKELTSKEKNKQFRPKAILDYKKLVNKMSTLYPEKSDQAVLHQMQSLYDNENITIDSVQNLLAEMEKDFNELSSSFKEKNRDKSLKLIDAFHRHALIRHDSLATFVYSYPTTAIETDGEKLAIELSNGSVLQNQKWLGLWELSKSLEPEELATFLAEHLRFHFSGKNREGATTIIEDDKKIRLVFDPCGSGGAIRRRLGSDVKNLQEKHNLAWNKCGEVNLYCSHCALNEKHSIDLFGYPKLVVEFQADANKPCGWTIYKNKEDVPQEVYQRLGLKK